MKKATKKGDLGDLAKESGLSLKCCTINEVSKKYSAIKCFPKGLKIVSSPIPGNLKHCHVELD